MYSMGWLSGSVVFVQEDFLIKDENIQMIQPDIHLQSCHLHSSFFVSFFLSFYLVFSFLKR